MLRDSSSRLRRGIPVLVAIALMATVLVAARKPDPSPEATAKTASPYAFTALPIAFPPGYDAGDRKVRTVNPAYQKIQSWISSVGAAIAINDLDGTGTSSDLCIVDSRTDKVVVTPVAGTGRRYTPFVLDPAPLPMDAEMAPMGCVPGDYNEDGRMDLLVYYWGRTPVLFLHRDSAGRLSNDAYRPQELVAAGGPNDGRYHGPRWNSNAVSVADFDGDGHPDIFVGNYFPDSGVLSTRSDDRVVMQHSMSHAENAGGGRILRREPDAGRAVYEEAKDAIPAGDAKGWTLAAASADLDGDLLPELYIANDFGPDHLLRNDSSPGHIRFTTLHGRRGPTTPKSKALGNDSFKGMGVDFADLRGNGRLDIFVSNITTSFGLQESNFAFMNDASDLAAARRQLHNGVAPFTDHSADLGLAWSGWSWDAKAADFDGSGLPAIVQTTGFVQGSTNRWPELQELAMANDELLKHPEVWPKFTPGDDLSGHQHLAFYASAGDGSYINIARRLGVGDTTPSRGIAIGDGNGDGAPDLAIARQWAAPLYYRNDSPSVNRRLTLDLVKPASDTSAGTGATVAAIGAQARVTVDGKTSLQQVDGGSGHSGKRDFTLSFGLGTAKDTPVRVEVRWIDTAGGTHLETLTLRPGRHTLLLDDRATEVTAS
ncbi:CRTAC1 family protein [Streptomyces dysideae]|uniref:RNA-binding protein n=1 Tax=Streptomyces dysideae TaxID=909626 RepID=A0A101UT79_9ACTN|nr:CRTAC1 family protein [Streptomyces dysideae]KUO16449.1 RNA-binding protein [Streptomyces dysideae]